MRFPVAEAEGMALVVRVEEPEAMTVGNDSTVPLDTGAAEDEAAAVVVAVAVAVVVAAAEEDTAAEELAAEVAGVEPVAGKVVGMVTPAAEQRAPAAERASKESKSLC